MIPVPTFRELAESADYCTPDMILFLERTNPATMLAVYEALAFFIERHIAFVNSGDAGTWDPETDPEIIKARAALKLLDGAGETK